MSLIDLQEAKDYLLVFHSANDARLQLLLDAAEDEALQFLDRENLTDWECVVDDPQSDPVSEVLMPASVRLGIFTFLQAAYEASPSDQHELRKVGERLLMPYRRNLGV